MIGYHHRMPKLLEILKERLTLSNPGITGCRRRNVWTDEQTKWSHLRGNALLAILGDRHEVNTPRGDFSFYLVGGRFLIQFRGGQWNMDWVEDFLDEWSVAVACGQLDLSHTIYVLVENKGQLTVTEVTVPDDHDADARAGQIFDELAANPPARISKGGARAMRVCRYCPCKMRCDATDTLQGDTQDWSPSYQKLRP